MNIFSVTEVIAALFPTRIGSPQQFMVVSQENAAGAMKLYTGVGALLRFVQVEDNGSAGGSLYDITNVTSVNVTISNDNGVLLAKVMNIGGNITDEQWNGGVRPTAEHFNAFLTADDLNIAPGVYKLGVFGNTNNPLSPKDFYVECKLTILATSALPGAFNETLSDPTLYAALLAAVEKNLGDYALKIGAPGARIALTTANQGPAGTLSAGKYGRIWLAANFDADGTLLLDQQKELIDNP